jgi:dipeptidyl-peptidase-4
MRLSFYLPCLFLACSITGIAQKQLTIDEIFTKTDLSPKSLKGLQWIPNTNAYTSIPDEKTDVLLRTFADKGTTDTLLKASMLSSELKRMPAITWLDANRFYFRQKNLIQFCQIPFSKISSSFDASDAENIDVEPKNEAIAYTKANNLFVFAKGSSINISKEENDEVVYGQSVHRNEFGITKGTFWSPTGRYLAFYRMDQSMVTNYPLVSLENLPAEATPIKYPMAGQKSHQVTLGIYDTQKGQTIYVKTAGPDEHYLTNISWSPDEKYVLIAELNRGQNEMHLNQYQVLDGGFVKTLFNETDPQWVEPEHPALFIPGKNDQFIWQSERDGFDNLYLYDLNGKLLSQITKGNYVVTDVLGFDASGKNVISMIADNYGLDRKLIKASLKGDVPILTPESGVHEIQMNSSGTYFIDNFSNLTTPRSIRILDAKGKTIKVLLKSADPLLDYALSKPELMQVKASDGTMLNGRLFKPTNFDASKKYPVVIYVYGGPHAQMVSNRWMAGGNLWMSWMASQGYLVFTLDNRGSGERGLEFEQAVHRKLGTVEMEDQMTGVNYLKSLPFVDANRIGVHGWSFGGFMTSTLMTKNPGVFKAGVAGGPVIDWKMYEIMYTERYMDSPEENKEGYETSNLLNGAKSLKDRLMLIHGTIDDVVVWQHSQAMVKKCVDEGVLIDYMIYPEHPHNVQGKDRLHLYKTVSRYLMENLK